MAAMPQASPFAPEQFGPYVLLRHLGRGGMADVYKARVEGVAGFARHIVVKRILKVHTAEPHFVEMFINEAKIAARLCHPNIVQVYELGEFEGELFMAMEYVRGQDLLRLMRSAAAAGHPAPPPAIGAFILREVARALAHAHEHVDENNVPRPIIHRDVSPQNVMIGFDGQVKLVDFGIAKAVTAHHEGTHTGSLKGKFGYMAPEQIDNGICTPQTDVFSAGVVLHEVLTGRRLFKGQTDYDTMTKVKSAPLHPPSSTNPNVSPILDAAVMLALHRDPAQRYQRASQLSRDLDGYLQQERFTMEDVAAWVRQVVPLSEREEGGESQIMAPSAGTPRTTPTGASSGASRARPRLSVAQARRAPESLGDLGGMSMPMSPERGYTGSAAGDPAPGSGGRTMLVLGLLGVMAVSLGAVLWILRPHGHVPPVGPVAPVAEHQPPVANPPGPPGAPMLVLDSDPTAAVVYAGPRRLGQTPLTVDLRGDALDVVLSLPGHPDLYYTLHRGDGPRIMLRLPPPSDRTSSQHHDHHHGHPGVETKTPAPETPAPPERKPLRVKVIDDDDHSQSAQPGKPSSIKAIDE